jgi:molecular chaperone DnaK
MSVNERVIGIDLGTTNSCVASVDNGVAVVIPCKGHATTPSIVAITASGRRLVGHIAKRQASTNPTGTIHSAKRIIGRAFAHPTVKQAQERLAYQIVAGATGDARLEVNKKHYAVPEISATILRELKEAAELHFGGTAIEKAVITVPAYFNDGQRQATKDAGRIAGLDVLRIISEPTAAALAHGMNAHKEKTRVVVFDLGGGTFDVSVLDIVGGAFEVIATSGDTYLGGDDFDLRVVDWLFAELKREHKSDARGDIMVLQRLRDTAEKAKIALSTDASHEINLPFLFSMMTPTGRVPIHLVRTLTREQLETLVADLVRRCIEITAAMLDQAKIALHQVNEIVLVGGMTRMPAVRAAVRQYFGMEPARNVNPDEVVALGAAIHANALMHASAGANPSLLLLDVTPHNLGIMIAGGYFRTLVPANSTVPTSATHVFATAQDNQTAVKIVVMQGAHEVANKNEVLGEFMLSKLPAGPRGAVQIEVTFDISAEGIVFVSGTNLATGEEASVEVTANERLAEAELEQLVRENNRFGVTDAGQTDELVRAVTALMGDVERLMPRAREALSTSGHDQSMLQKTQQFLVHTAAAVKARDSAALDASREQLTLVRTLLNTMVAGIPAA